MKLKKMIMPLLQVCVTFLLLWWIFHDPAKRAQMTMALKNAELFWLIPGFICFGLVLLCSTMRWSILLSIQKIDFGWKRTWCLVMIGMFFNLFLLGSVGGDVLKIFYAMREVPKQKTAVFFSIIFDRFIGMFSLMFVTLTVCFCSYEQLIKTRVTEGLFTTVLVVFSGFIIFIIFSFLVNYFHLWRHIPSWIPGHRAMIDIASALSAYASERKVLIRAVFYSLLMNLFLFGSGICAAYAFARLPGAPGAGPMIVVMPIVNTICNIPISLSGIGVREGLFETLLNTLYGTPKSLAVLISLTSFSLTVFWSLLGGCFYLFYRPSSGGPISLHAMSDEVELLEEVIEKSAE